MNISHANYQFWLFAVGGSLLALAYGTVWPRSSPSLAPYELGVAIDPGYALGHYNLGVADQRAGNFDGALAHFRAAAAADPHDHTECLDHAIVATRVHALDEALASATCAADHDGTAAAYAALGRVQLAREDWAAAAAALEQAIARDPHQGPIELDLGAAYVRLGRTADAEAAWRAAVADDAMLADASFDLGLLAQQRDDVAEARARYTAALAADPKLTKAMANLAALEAMDNHPAAAIELLDRLLALEPGNAKARALRAELAGHP